MISLNDSVISLPVALAIFFAIIFPPIIFLNYKLFKISRKMRRDNTASPEESTLHVNLKKIHTCLLAVACLMLMYTLLLSSLLRLTSLKSRRQKIRWCLDFGPSL
jgi:hypothetical protein